MMTICRLLKLSTLYPISFWNHPWKSSFITHVWCTTLRLILYFTKCAKCSKQNWSYSPASVVSWRDPIHPPTHSPYLFISTSWGRVSSFPCRCSLLLPLLRSLLFHSSFPGNWVWVLVVGSKGLGWSCWELCVCVCECVRVCWEVS